MIHTILSFCVPWFIPFKSCIEQKTALHRLCTRQSVLDRNIWVSYNIHNSLTKTLNKNYYVQTSNKPSDLIHRTHQTLWGMDKSLQYKSLHQHIIMTNMINPSLRFGHITDMIPTPVWNCHCTCQLAVCQLSVKTLQPIGLLAKWNQSSVVR